MILSTKGRYAVMAMVDLAAQKTSGPVTLAAIAERQEIPLAYLEQIFAKLKRAGIVSSVRGPGGGYKLGKPVDMLTIAEIVLASEESIKMTRCDGEIKACMASKTQCLTHDLWQGLGEQIQNYLGTLTLEDVVARRVKDKFPRGKHTSDVTMFADLVTQSSATA
jgi:Rrf2 family iron-sulfur cluster assembly transcriptional regulator